MKITCFLLASSIKEEQDNHRQISYVQVPLLWDTKVLNAETQKIEVFLWEDCAMEISWRKKLFLSQKK